MTSPTVGRNGAILFFNSIIRQKHNRIAGLVLVASLAVSVYLHAGLVRAQGQGEAVTIEDIVVLDSAVPLPPQKPAILAPKNKSVSSESLLAASEKTIDPSLVKSAGEEEESAQFIPIPSPKPLIAAKLGEELKLEEPSKPNIVSKLPPSKGTLSPADQKRYADIFRAQDDGDFDAADSKITALENGVLMGHVLAHRYLHPKTKASYAELRDWLDRYADHPQAERIYRLADSRRPEGVREQIRTPLSRKSPIIVKAGQVSEDGKLYVSSLKRTETEKEQTADLLRTIRARIQDYEPTQALRLLETHPGRLSLDNVEFDQARALIGAGYLYAGNSDDALKYASAAMNRSGQYAPMGAWVSGLAYWQRQNYKRAARAFEVAATSPYSSGWMVSAAAYWASRAHMRDGNVRVVSHWLDKAASYPRTFYGLIATRALGQDHDFNWERPSADGARLRVIENTPAGQRGRVLAEIGRFEEAEAELRSLYDGANRAESEALLSFAFKNNLPALTMRLAHAIRRKDGDLYDAALYPMIPWQPENGFTLDKALIHAFIRQESKFETSAQSTSGATGLMQLMPATARYIAGDGRLDGAQAGDLLRDPSVNLEIGQEYLESLLNNKIVEGDVMALAIAYNAGPGKLSQWKAERKGMKDPLLFIETIPYAETRAFVERVMSNYWIYRLQLGQPLPSLDAVAEGRWARYTSMDSTLKIAGN